MMSLHQAEIERLIQKNDFLESSNQKVIESHEKEVIDLKSIVKNLQLELDETNIKLKSATTQVFCLSNVWMIDFKLLF